MADAKTGFVWHSHDYQRIALEISNYFRDYTFGGEERLPASPAWKLNAKMNLGMTRRSFSRNPTDCL
ncbi:MAG: hypothetical protein IPJ30_23460 [Acidobacteria bacterium]|nr:hypothetical protein [Acidobacteriota bacterium]